ncbi:MAG: GNAT family N-acetyltransferase [Candidatus Nanoarchaeia archaeon]|nr:GNAT family N-acetyltransferase [Candidatus Nanoarchaeia archaeon]
MQITFKEYDDSFFYDLKKCMEELQDYIVSVDSLKRNRRLPKFGISYTKNIIKKVKKNNGLIILVYIKEKIAGCIVGLLENQPKSELLEYIPEKGARVEELIILKEFRGLGLGEKLMKKMEYFFKGKECTSIRIKVFEPNNKARIFYKKLGYNERVIDLFKIIK